LKALGDKTLDDYSSLKLSLNKKLLTLEKEMINVANAILDLIAENGIDHDDFKGKEGTIPRYFKNIKSNRSKVNLDNKWMSSIESESFYTKTTTDDIAQRIDNIRQEIIEAFYMTKNALVNYRFLLSIRKNLVPLSVLSLIKKEIDQIKQDENILLISEFNSVVSEHLQNEPVAFIYERIGERFKHFFIDEFQDTSVMQWKNLIPLMNNALAAENTSAMIVGDAKQSIYRWRGGKPEQFIDLYSHKSNPFQVEARIKDLEFNFRSLPAIVDFNNGFFSFVASTLFESSAYAAVYEKCKQMGTRKNNGYVQMSFHDYEKADESHAIFGKEVLEIIGRCRDEGFNQKDICLLVRTREQGKALADFLIHNSNFDVISSESLLLINSDEVNFILSMLEWLIDPINPELKFSLLYYLADKNLRNDASHQFIRQGLELSANQLERFLSSYAITVDFHELSELSIYEAVEYIIMKFGLVKHSDAYVQALMDDVFDYSVRGGQSINGYLEQFRLKQEKISIKSPEGLNAITIMTIHKAKGLEFPVVIFPYADLDLYPAKENKIWFPLDRENFSGFDRLYTNFNSNLELHSDIGSEIYQTRRSEMEFDTINLIYVVFTRAIERLYILSKRRKTSKSSKVKSTANLYQQYLEHIGTWQDNNMVYHFGKPTERSEIQESEDIMQIRGQLTLTPIKEMNIAIATNAGQMWDTRQLAAIEKGILIHRIMSEIQVASDLEEVLQQFMESGDLDRQQSREIKPLIHAIVNNDMLRPYYSAEYNIYNERSIIDSSGNLIRPDRIVSNDKDEVVIIDYKTGRAKQEHLDQVKFYAGIMSAMHCTVKNSFLVYIDEDIHIKEV
ncbi:MAG: UvrD-helicase domain-containing protein, partial [Bacteroidia bacterium]|nr:UvrD-helicase domain-containing protein [Bacteroidia bacterium]